MSEQSVDGAGNVDLDRQVKWANDCNDLRILAKSAEEAVRRENFQKAHAKINELRHRATDVDREYYDCTIDSDACQEDDQ